MNLTVTEPSMQKQFESGSGIEFKHIDDKILISAQCTTRLKEGEFFIEGDHVEIRAGHGVKISSIHPNILVITADTTKQDEKIYDLQKQVNARLETIEKVFSKILKQVKQ